MRAVGAGLRSAAMPMIDVSALTPGFCEASQVNPVTTEAEDTTVEWLWRIGFLTTQAQEAHLRSFKFGLYHGIATPDVDHDHLVLGLMWFCWGSLADDQYDNYEGGDRHGRMREVLRAVRSVVDGGLPDGSAANPVIAGLADFWPRLTSGLASRARQRITKHFLDYLEAVAFQNGYHALGRVPDAATFLTMRRNTIAMLFQADVLEVVCSVRVPDSLRDSFLFRELVSCFADITAWHNDVYGLEKDLADGQTCNIVRVVAASELCSIAEATERVLKRAEQRQRLLMHLQDQLPVLVDQLGLTPEAGAQAATLAWNLRRYAFANLLWINETHRYDLDLPRIRGTFDDMIGRPAEAGS